MKKRYISPVTKNVQMFEMGSVLLQYSDIKALTYGDELHNMNLDEDYEEEVGETFKIQF